MYSIKESENKDAECIFCNGKMSGNELGEIWIKCIAANHIEKIKGVILLDW